MHAEGVYRGAAVCADTADMARIETIGDGSRPVDMATRRAEYTAEGWERFNPDAIVPYRAGDKTMAQGQEGVTIP